MEFLPVSRTTSGVQIESIPDGVKVVQLGGPKAQRLADLGLHRADLQFAHDALEALNTSALSKFHREALWRSAIVHFFKCFSANEARFSLAPQSVYKGEPPEALENFTYFKDLRNKHLVHDENSYARSVAGAVLNDGTKQYKVEKIVVLSMFAETLEQNEYANFKLLIEKALGWVTKQIDLLCAVLTQELEAKPYSDLLAMPAITYTAPAGSELPYTRKTP